MPLIEVLKMKKLFLNLFIYLFINQCKHGFRKSDKLILVMQVEASAARRSDLFWFIGLKTAFQVGDKERRI